MFDPLPTFLDTMWARFYELSNRRQWGESGPALLTWQDMQAWQFMARYTLEPWQVSAINKLDIAFVNAWRKK